MELGRFPSALIGAATECGGACARAVSERGGRQGGCLFIQFIVFLNVVVLLLGRFPSGMANKKAVEYTRGFGEGCIYSGLIGQLVTGSQPMCSPRLQKKWDRL